MIRGWHNDLVFANHISMQQTNFETIYRSIIDELAINYSQKI